MIGLVDDLDKSEKREIKIEEKDIMTISLGGYKVHGLFWNKDCGKDKCILVAVETADN